MQKIFRIRNDSASSLSTWAALASILEAILPVSFEQSPAETQEPTRAGEVALKWLPSAEAAGVDSSFTCPAVSAMAGADLPELSEVEIFFTEDPGVPFPFRGRSLKTKVAKLPAVLNLEAGERILAFTHRGAVWSISDNGRGRNYRCGFALPPVSPNSTFKDVFNEVRFLELLPLIHWLREVSEVNLSQRPVPQACFIFDDPNLHWPSYGYVNYRELAKQAATHNYHVTFATIPLDGWFTHQGTARVFRENQSFLSLAVHGNNHIKQELAHDYSEVERAAMLKQAIHRIERIERRAGLPVCRVMIPPHGACVEEVLALLPLCGFEAACLSHGSLRAHNRGKSWTRNLGYFPSELVKGCPVLPRWGLFGNIEAAILLAAYLGQPVILRGHHEDLKEGIELLAQRAEFINSLGAVRWLNLTELSRANYEWRMIGTTCYLKLLGRRIDFKIPDGATGLVIESPSNEISPAWRVTNLAAGELTVPVGEELAIPPTFKGKVALAASGFGRDLPSAIKAPRPPLTAVIRRLLTETRDRLAF